MMLKKISKRIFIKHEHLDYNILNHIYSKLCETTKDNCDKENGHILKINKNIKIDDIFSSSVNGDIIVIVLFEAVILKPEIGKIFDGQICMIFSNGIFVNISNKQKVLIPLSYLTDFTYNEKDKIFYNDNKILKLNDNIKVIIEGVKYAKNSFNCFGRVI